jgi:hypothetical protein
MLRVEESDRCHRRVRQLASHATACSDEKTVYIANEFSYRFDKIVLEDGDRPSRR